MNRAIGENLPFLVGEKMKIEWPLFWCLSVSDQAKLIQWQFDTYGFRLQIPPMPDFAHIDTEIESPEEIARIIKRPPRHQKRVV